MILMMLMMLMMLMTATGDDDDDDDDNDDDDDKDADNDDKDKDDDDDDDIHPSLHFLCRPLLLSAAAASIIISSWIHLCGFLYTTHTQQNEQPCMYISITRIYACVHA